jgi:hypothetical protein
MFHGVYWPFQALLDAFSCLLILLEGPDNLLIYDSSTKETLTSSSNDPTPLYTGKRYLGSLFPNSLWSTQTDRNLQLSYKYGSEIIGKDEENTYFGSLATCTLSTSYMCAMNQDFRGLRQRPIKSDGLRSCPFADRINLLGACPHMLAGKVS